MANSNLDEGIYTLQVYASAVGVPPATVTQNFEAQYGTDELSNVGAASQGIDYGALKTAFQATPSGQDASVSPTYADITGAQLSVGATIPSDTSLVVAGVAESATEAVSAAETVGGGVLSGLKYVAIIALVLAAGYIAFQAGVFKRAVRGP